MKIFPTRNSNSKPQAGRIRVRKEDWTFLFLLYIGAVIFRAIMAVLLRDGPIVVIDEGLYTNIARSIAFDGQIAFRRQPVLYPYIFYSLLLVPVYRLQALCGGDIYHWVQVFNAILICTSIFPAWFFAVEYTGDLKKSRTVALLTALMPDMIICAFEMNESVLWPLGLCTLLFAWRILSRKEIRWGVLTGVFTGLMYYTKPGAVVMGAALLIMLLIFRLKDADVRKSVFAGIGATLLVVAFVYFVYCVIFGNDFTLIGLYKKQTSDWEPSHAVIAVEGFVMMLIMTGIGLAGVFMFLPYLRLKAFSDDQRKFIWATTVGMLLLIGGTAFFVTPYQWSGDYLDIPFFLRYSAMYTPAWIVFTLADGVPVTGKDKKKPALGVSFGVTMFLFTVLAVAAGLFVALCGHKTSSESLLSVSPFIENGPLRTRVPAIIFVVVIAVCCLLPVRKFKFAFDDRMKKICVGCLTVTLLFTNITGYKANSIKITRGVEEDSLTLNRVVGDKTVLGVVQKYYDNIYSYWEDARLTYPMHQVTCEQMLVSMEETGGVYRPFVPYDQAPIVGSKLTPETDMIILGQTIGERMEISDLVSAAKTPNRLYTIVYLKDGVRWLDTAIYGTDVNGLEAGARADIIVYGGREGVMPVTLNIRASRPGTEVTVSQGSHVETFPITSETETISADFQAGTVTITANNPIEILDYSTR